MAVPRYLFRGDRDAHNVRQVRENWNRGWLATNLAAGGYGREIFRLPLVENVRRHVSLGWRETHFLSFTSDRGSAERYALGEEAGVLVPLPCDAPEWGTSIFTFDSSRLDQYEQTSTGIYIATFSHRRAADLPLPKFSMGAIARQLVDDATANTQVRLVVLDVATLLRDAQHRQHSKALVEAIGYAERDAEWLLLPADPFYGGAAAELTALLDDSCISTREKFAIGHDGVPGGSD